MSTKLLVAGIGLTFLALSSEPKLTKPALAARAEAAADVDDNAASSHRAFGRSSSGIGFVVAQAVSESLSKSEQTLQELESPILNTEGERGKKAREMAEEAALSIDKARGELEEHRSFAAMDHAMHAANRIEDLKRLLIERR